MSIPTIFDEVFVCRRKDTGSSGYTPLIENVYRCIDSHQLMMRISCGVHQFLSCTPAPSLAQRYIPVRSSDIRNKGKYPQLERVIEAAARIMHPSPLWPISAVCGVSFRTIRYSLIKRNKRIAVAWNMVLDSGVSTDFYCEMISAPDGIGCVRLMLLSEYEDGLDMAAAS